MAIDERAALGRKMLAHATRLQEGFQFFSDWLLAAPGKIHEKLVTVQKGADGRASAIDLPFGRVDVYYQFSRNGDEPVGQILFVKPTDALPARPIILKKVVIDAAGYVYFDSPENANAFEWNSQDELIPRNLIRLAYELAIEWTDAPAIDWPTPTVR